ncbi:MAG: hypothetical protein P8126_08690 [Gammaproteobacteria bacterium]|jgi:hypothetical protein
MKTKILIFICAACLSGSAIAADKGKMTDAQKEAMQARVKELNAACNYPHRPTIPDGQNSTKDDMLKAQAKMKAFLKDGNNYIECLDKVEKGWGDKATDNDHAVVVVLHNKAVDDMQSVADLFNTAVRAFQGKK